MPTNWRRTKSIPALSGAMRLDLVPLSRASLARYSRLGWTSYKGSAHETESIPLTEYCRYSEFRNIPSCPFLPMADADKARRADFLNSEYSCQSTWRQKQKWIVVRPKTKSFEGTRICVGAGPEIKNGRRNESQKSAS